MFPIVIANSATDNEKHLTYYSADAALASPNFQITGQPLKNTTGTSKQLTGAFYPKPKQRQWGAFPPCRRFSAGAQTQRGVFYPISETCQTGGVMEFALPRLCFTRVCKIRHAFSPA